MIKTFYFVKTILKKNPHYPTKKYVNIKFEHLHSNILLVKLIFMILSNKFLLKTTLERANIIHVFCTSANKLNLKEKLKFSIHHIFSDCQLPKWCARCQNLHRNFVKSARMTRYSINIVQNRSLRINANSHSYCIGVIAHRYGTKLHYLPTTFIK